MTVVVVDNKDSFVWNLVEYLSRIESDVKVVSNIITSAFLEKRFSNLKGVVISPGPGTPRRKRDVGSCIEIIKNLVEIPILGICLGHQALGFAYGAEIKLSPSGPVHGKISKIFHDRKTIFKGLPEPMRVGRYHSLVVENPPRIMEVSARTSDGIIMALRHKNRPLEGVQFHPESVLSPQGFLLMENWYNEYIR
jgi:anthranilate synthase component 2